MTKQILDKIKAISIHAPHAYAICLGLKPFEYRNSPTKRRGWVLIHASQSKDSDYCFKEYKINPADIKRSAIIGAAYIADCIPDSQGGYAYRMTRAILFKTPIEKVKGCQAVFWGHCKDPHKIRAFEQAIEQIRINLKARG
ncbi:MAG: hypothetical protein HXY43_22345 [Fischerella sp.]|uniref:hypothetical protein n=1 Tax=Fischerella sp. TaxID=1191 RepID=UPI0011AECBCD|nr:hypothetical protein [Fischerella sp.]NWF61914.1 hypothetical protein [Fischerella sp.]